MTTTSVQPPRSTRAPSVGAPERIRNQWVDALVNSDPGLNRLRLAAQSTLTIAAALAAEWLFVHFTGALQMKASDTASTATATKVAVANHDLLAIAMLLGAIVGLIVSWRASRRRQRQVRIASSACAGSASSSSSAASQTLMRARRRRGA